MKRTLLTKFGLIIIPCIAIQSTLAADRHYTLNYNGDDVGYSRIIVKPLLKEEQIKGEKIAEISEITHRSFWGDTDIRSSKLEHYDNNQKISQGVYALLYEQYLVLSSLEQTESGKLKQKERVFELEEPLLSTIREGWKQSFETSLSNPEPISPYNFHNKILKPIESEVNFIDPRNFDLTLSYLSTHLPEILTKFPAKKIRIFNPESDDENPFYNVIANIENQDLAPRQTKEQDTSQRMTVIRLLFDKKAQIEYWYQESAESTRLVKIIDSTREKRIQMTLTKF